MKRTRNIFSEAMNDAEDRQWQRLFNALPEPGPAYVAARVMHHIRKPERSTAVLGLRHLIWGVASGTAGLFLGMWLASATLPEDNGSLSSLGEYVYVVEDGLDYLIADLSTSQNGEEL